MKNLNALAIAVITILTCAPLTALAEGRLYLGGSIGTASLNDDFDGFDIDTDSVSLRLIVGWQFNDYFALEGGYHNFGDFEQNFDAGGEPVDVILKADGFTLGVTGTLPLGDKFALFGRAGSFFWDGDAEINNVTQAKPEDTNLYFGAGARYAFSDRLYLLADWSRYELEDTQSNVASLGLTVSF